MKLKNLKINCIFILTLSYLNNIWGQNELRNNNSQIELLEKNIESNKSLTGKIREENYIRLIKEHLKDDEIDKLNLINEYINSHIEYETDMQAWNKVDYWSTPLELLNNGAGDCEDFAIAKYYGLKMIGINAKKLRLVYVKYQSYKEDITQSHMVLSYITKDDKVLILDNLLNEIKTSEERKDLSPVFSFNDEGIYMEVSDEKLNVSLSKWTEVIKKAKTEGW